MADTQASSPQLAKLRSFLERYVRVTVADGRVLVGKLWVRRLHAADAPARDWRTPCGRVHKAIASV
jgi:hypothetical protein